MKVKNIVIGGLLTALSIMIPMMLAGTPLMVFLPPGFTATITAHIPIMLAMAFTPGVAAAVAIGSALGFTLKLNAMIGARALTHIVFGVTGSYAYNKGMSFTLVLLLTAPIHGLMEGLVLIPFGVGPYQAFVVTAIGTMIHHAIDGIIAVTIYQVLIKSALLKKPSIGR